MKSALLTVGIVTLFGVAVIATLPGAYAADDETETIDIKVSPSVIVLDSEGTWVTVHADIRYWAVDTLSLFLNGISVTFTKADDRGDLVAKFCLDDVKGILDEEILEAGCVELRMSGTMKDPEAPAFEGVDTVRVVKGGRD